MKVKVNYVGLLNRLEQTTGKQYSDRYVAKASQVRRQTLIDMRYERLKAVSLGTFEKLGTFFVEHGLDIKAGDLLIVAEDPLQLLAIGIFNLLQRNIDLRVVIGYYAVWRWLEPQSPPTDNGFGECTVTIVQLKTTRGWM